MSNYSLLGYCSSLCWCLSRSTSFSLVFWNASCNIFDVLCATATLLDNSSFCLNINSNVVVRSDNCKETHSAITEHCLPTLEMTV